MRESDNKAGHGSVRRTSVWPHLTRRKLQRATAGRHSAWPTALQAVLFVRQPTQQAPGTRRVTTWSNAHSTRPGLDLTLTPRCHCSNWTRPVDHSGAQGTPARTGVPFGTQTSEPPGLEEWVPSHRPGLRQGQWVFVFPGGPAQLPEENGPF